MSLSVIDIGIPDFKWKTSFSPDMISQLKAKELTGEIAASEAARLHDKMTKEIRENHDGYQKILSKIPQSPGHLIFQIEFPGETKIVGFLTAKYDMLDSFRTATRRVEDQEMTYLQWMRYLLKEHGCSKIQIRILR